MTKPTDVVTKLTSRVKRASSNETRHTRVLNEKSMPVEETMKSGISEPEEFMSGRHGQEAPETPPMEHPRNGSDKYVPRPHGEDIPKPLETWEYHLDDLPIHQRSHGDNRRTRLARRRCEQLLDEVLLSLNRVQREAVIVRWRPSWQNVRRPKLPGESSCSNSCSQM